MAAFLHGFLQIAVLIFFPRCYGEDLISPRLDLSNMEVEVTGICCPVTVTDCSEEECLLEDFQPENLVDGDATSEWVVEFVSKNSDNGPIADLTFDLGQVYSLHSMALLSTTLPLPRRWILMISLDGETFSQAMEFSNDGLYEQAVFLNKGEEETQASHLRLVVSLPSEASPEPVSIAEVIVTVTGNDLDLVEETSCGICVQPLTDLLDNLTTVINDTMSSIVVRTNETQEELVEMRIMETQLMLDEYESTLLVLAVVLGNNTVPIDEDTLSPGITRLDLQLVPPIPDKLDQLGASIELLENLNLSTEELRLLLEIVDSRITSISSTIAELEPMAADGRDNFTSLVANLTNQLNETTEALRETTVILEILSNRRYSDEMMDLEKYLTLSKSEFIVSTQQLNLISIINNQVDFDAAISNISILIQEAINIIVQVNERSSETQRNAAATDDIIQQVEVLSSEVIFLNSKLNDSIVVVMENITTARDLIRTANDSLEILSILLRRLVNLISQLSNDLNEYDTFLFPYRPSCNLSSDCPTEDEFHAEMLRLNGSEIVNSSVSIYTLRRARSILESIESTGFIFDYSEINLIALRAQNISDSIFSQLSTVNIPSLQNQATSILSDIMILNQRTLSLVSLTNDTSSKASSLESLLSQLETQSDNLFQDAILIRNQTDDLFESTGLAEEARMLLVTADNAQNRTSTTGESVTEVENELTSVSNSLSQIRENVLQASEELDTAESKFDSISLFLDETQRRAEEFVVNVTAFITENERIIGDIDNLIASLADVHSRVNQINSPIQLVTVDDDRSYLSLQPPPGRLIDDTIQFETIDLFLWTGVQFTIPSILFYAGPVYHENTDNINAAGESKEDYFLLTVEMGNLLRLRWSMGGLEGESLTPGYSQGFSEIYVARQGSQFQVRYGVAVGELGDPMNMGNLNNDSLLFRVSNRTAFLLGGWPSGAQLGLPASEVSLEDYNTFQGQVQLFLFNGEPWGLWNIRGASRASFIGPFQRSLLASANTWRPRTQSTSTSTISFDGNGYLFVEQFGSLEEEDYDDNGRIMDIITRPTEERDGLVLYAFDETLELSMEIAYSNGNLRMLIRHHGRGIHFVNYTQESTEAIVNRLDTEGRRLTILHAEGRGFMINSDVTLTDNAIFFTDLTRVKAWYGGVREDLLISPYVPELTNSSYFGCVDVFVTELFVSNLFRGDHFFTYYLGSKTQRGLAGTCFTSIYTREVGFDGRPDSYLSYTYFNFVAPTNGEVVGGASANGARQISFSFLAQKDEGVLLLALGEESYIAVLMRNGKIEVQIGATVGDNTVRVLDSNDQVESGVWYYLFIELGADSYALYLDGLIQETQSSIPGLDLEVNTDSGDTSSTVLYLGGSTEAIPIPGLVEIDVSSFMGCMRDFSYNFSAMSFNNPGLTFNRRYPEGILYNTCPFFNAPMVPALAVRPEEPIRRVCLAESPSEVEGTHGGFHRDTNLTSSNVLRLINSSWVISMSLRQMSDGHVLSVGSVEGHVISLRVRNGQAVLSLTELVASVGSGDGPTEEGLIQEFVGPQLIEGMFISVAINCTVDELTLSCFLSVDGTTSGSILRAAYMGQAFFPQIPLLFGETEEERSFIGCISDLATNGESTGFSDLQTDVECFNRIQPGLGFSGISRLGYTLPGLNGAEQMQSLSVIFQPQEDNGLLLTLSALNASIPEIAIGLFNGELRLSTLNATYTVLSPSVCDPNNPDFYNISLTRNGLVMEVVIRGAEQESPHQFPFSLTQELVLTLGSTAAEFVVPDGTDLFRFLLSENLPQDELPPGFLGCVSDLLVDGDSQLMMQTTISIENILDGFCPI